MAAQSTSPATKTHQGPQLGGRCRPFSGQNPGSYLVKATAGPLSLRLSIRIILKDLQGARKAG